MINSFPIEKASEFIIVCRKSPSSMAKNELMRVSKNVSDKKRRAIKDFLAPIALIEPISCVRSITWMDKVLLIIIKPLSRMIITPMFNMRRRKYR